MFAIDINLVLSQMVLGLVNGVFYAILSLGLAIIFGLLGVINFAHGVFFMLGAFIAVHALVADKFVEFRLHRDNVGFKSEDAELLIRVARDSQRARGVQDGT